MVWASGEGWHPGVVGIVASRLKENSNRPSIVIGFENGIGKGSGRSVSGIDLGAPIQRLANEGLLIKGGGHKMAAGLTVAENKLEAAMERLSELLDKNVLKKINFYDDIIDSSNINRDLYNLIKLASPYGQGNPEPQFIIKNAKIDFWSEVGTGHLKVKLSNANYGNIDAIAFGAKGTAIGDLLMNHSGGLLHIAGVIKKNDWQGNKAVQFHIRDLFTA